MQLFADAPAAPRSYGDLDIGLPVDLVEPLESVDVNGVRAAIDPQPERVVTVPVDLNVAGDSPYLALDSGPARATFTLVKNDGSPWLIHSVRVEQ